MGRKARVARPATRYTWRMPDTPGPSTTPGLTPAPTPTITPKPNGPLVVVGLVRIVTPDGRELPVPPRKDGRPAEVVVLCRCGGSQTKPFCDGTHKRNGFCDTPTVSPAPTS